MKKLYMYMTSYGKVAIKKVEIVKETPKQVIVLDRDGWGKVLELRCNKRGESQNFFHTWEEAHEFLIKKAEGKVDLMKSRLHEARSNLGQIKSMKEI